MVGEKVEWSEKSLVVAKVGLKVVRMENLSAALLDSERAVSMVDDLAER